MPSKKSDIIKEYQPNQISMRGPGDWNAKPVETSPTIILRSASGLTTKKLGSIFNEIAKDYPAVRPADVTIENDRVTFTAKTAAKGYTRLPPSTFAARG